VGLPRVRAAIAARQGQLDKSVGLLHLPSPYEYATSLVLNLRAPRVFENCLGVFHQRGQVYLALKDGARAAADFQQILDHPGLGPLTPAYALAALNLGRAYALTGNGAKARAAYDRFFARWKDADPDLPVLVEAKKEYARLQ
jgi:tetratricopeptide (TPR) repeat protein